MQQAPATCNDVACVGFSGQMHGAVLLGAEGDVIRPAIIWCDQRTEKTNRGNLNKSSVSPASFNSPAIARSQFHAHQLPLGRENEPQNWARVRHVMLPKDYIRYRLTGDPRYRNGRRVRTLMLDVTNRRWSIEILTGAKIPREWLLLSLRISGRMREALQRRRGGATGLKFGTRSRRRRRRSSCGRRRNGIVRAGRRQRQRSARPASFSLQRSPRSRSAGPAAHFLPRDSRPLACDGRNQAADFLFAGFRDQFGRRQGR